MAPIPSGTVGGSNDKVNFISATIKGINAERETQGAYRPRRFSRKGQIRNTEHSVCVWSSFRRSLRHSRPPVYFTPVLADVVRWGFLPFCARDRCSCDLHAGCRHRRPISNVLLVLIWVGLVPNLRMPSHDSSCWLSSGNTIRGLVYFAIMSMFCYKKLHLIML